MTTYGLVLFLHLLAVVAAFAFAAVIHLGVERLRGAGNVDEAIAGLKLTVRGGRKMPWIALALLLTGAYLTQARWSWTTPWVLVSLAGLIGLEALGGISGKRNQRQLGKLLAHPRSALLTPEIRTILHDGFTRATHYLLPALAIGIMLVMVTKPGVALGVLELVIAAAIGAAIGMRPASATPAGKAADLG